LVELKNLFDEYWGELNISGCRFRVSWDKNSTIEMSDYVFE